MENRLNSINVAILATDGFELSELAEPQKALEENGAKTHIVSIKEGKITSWDKTNWGPEFTVDKTLDQAKAEDYDALVLPGGVMNPDKLRMNQDAVDFVERFMEEGKPVAAICHGPWILIETDTLEDRRITSYPSIQTDLINAGAHWVDEEVVKDANLISSRSPKDLPAFNKTIVEELAKIKQKKAA